MLEEATKLWFYVTAEGGGTVRLRATGARGAVPKEERRHRRGRRNRQALVAGQKLADK